MPQSSDREEFVYWLDDVISSAVPLNFEEFTHKQLSDHIYIILFRKMEERGLVPADVDEADGYDIEDMLQPEDWDRLRTAAQEDVKRDGLDRRKDSWSPWRRSRKGSKS